MPEAKAVRPSSPEDWGNPRYGWYVVFVLTLAYTCSFIGALIASGIGPLIQAMLTDDVFKDPLMLRYSVSIVAGSAAVLSLLILSVGLAPYGESVQRARNAWADASDGGCPRLSSAA